MSYTHLSVNINKIATLRNSRGGNTPDIIQFAIDCEKFGADGITVHPRPDERHIKYQDVYNLKNVIKGEFNIEGNPKEQKFINLVLQTQPTQVTLVPDAPNAITSNAGWDCIKELDFLKETISLFQQHNIRTSIFIDPIPQQIEYAKKTLTNRIELYTENYAQTFPSNPSSAITPYQKAATIAHQLGLEINAGHDLSLKNIQFLKQHIPIIKEVSIGHALISEALYLGIQNTIGLYKNKLQHFNHLP